MSKLHVIAALTGSSETPDADVTIKEVVGAGGASENKPGDRITVANLKGIGSEQGWREPGDSILPLMKWKDGTLAHHAVPASPGYNPGQRAGPVRVYPATDAARRQLTELARENHERRCMYGTRQIRKSFLNGCL